MAETYWEGADRKKKNMGYFMVFTFLRCRSVHNNRPELSFVNLKLNKKKPTIMKIVSFLEEWLLQIPQQ